MLSRRTIAVGRSATRALCCALWGTALGCNATRPPSGPAASRTTGTRDNTAGAAAAARAPSIPARVPWRTDATAALAEARSRGRHALLLFCATWAAACEELLSVTFADPRVRAAIEDGYVPVRVSEPTESDTPDASTELIRTHRVRGMPTLVLLDGAGREVGRVQSFVDADTLLEHLRRARAAAP